MNGPFVLHCGVCGWPMPTCKCQQVANAAAPAGIALPPRVKQGFYLVCSVCRMVAEYCACGRQPAQVAAQDGNDSNLNARIRALKGGPS